MSENGSPFTLDRTPEMGGEFIVAGEANSAGEVSREKYTIHQLELPIPPIYSGINLMKKYKSALTN